MSREGAYAELADLVRIRHQASGFTFLPRQPITSVLSGRHASRLRGRGLNFEEIRRYRAGDDVRTMDWKVTNRTRKPHVRVYTEEKDRPAWLLVDQRRSMFFGSVAKFKSVTAAELTALSAWRVLAQGDRVGAVIFNDEEIVTIRPQRSQRTVMRILGEVVRMNHALGADGDGPESPAMFNRAFLQVSRAAKHDALVVTISDGLGADEDSVRIAARIAEHNDLICTLVFDPLEVEMPDAGPVVLSDGGRQLQVNTSSTRFRKAYRADFAGRVERLREVAARRGIPLLEFDTRDEVAAQARRIFGRRRGGIG